MNVAFSALGLNFEADVRFGEGFPGSYYEPPEAPEAEILSLTVDGSDALFLLDSVMCDAIYEAVDELAPEAEECHERYNPAEDYAFSH